MKGKWTLMLVAALMAVSLAGCSSKDTEESPSVIPASQTPAGNDAFEGGGAGGTNDPDNDGSPEPDHSQDVDGNDPMNDVEEGVEDIGDAAGDIARGAGDAVGDVARGIGDAAGDVARGIDNAMTGKK